MMMMVFRIVYLDEVLMVGEQPGSLRQSRDFPRPLTVTA
jgi:hypothetical protein